MHLILALAATSELLGIDKQTRLDCDLADVQACVASRLCCSYSAALLEAGVMGLRHSPGELGMEAWHGTLFIVPVLSL